MYIVLPNYGAFLYYLKQIQLRYFRKKNKKAAHWNMLRRIFSFIK
jgi:hypothetical protein